MKELVKKVKVWLGLDENYPNGNKFVLWIYLSAFLIFASSFLISFQEEAFYDFSAKTFDFSISNYYNISYFMLAISSIINICVWWILRKTIMKEKDDIDNRLSLSKKLTNCFNCVGWLFWIMTLVGAAIAVSNDKHGTIIALYSIVFQKIIDKFKKIHKYQIKEQEREKRERRKRRKQEEYVDNGKEKDQEANRDSVIVITNFHSN